MFSKKSSIFFLTIAFTGLMSGCVSTIPVNYAPSSVKTVAGSVGVDKNFRYLPADSTSSATPVKNNQIRNTAVGNIFIDKDVSAFIRDAVFSELRTVGIKTNDSSNVLGGDIVEFLIDDLGYSVDWTLKIKYTVKSNNGSVIYQSEKLTQRKTNKFVNVFAAMNETIKLNAESLMDDPEFKKVIQP